MKIGAPEVPDAFWDLDALRQAFASQHMGKVVRAYRAHPFHGRTLSQEVVARWMHTTQPRLSRMENGPRGVHLDRLVQTAVALGIPQRCLWFSMPAGEPSVAGAMVGSTVSVPGASTGSKVSETLRDDAGGDVLPHEATVEMISDFTSQDLLMTRRQLAVSVGEVTVGVALLQPIEEWLSRIEPSGGGIPEVSEAGDVEQLERTARVFRDWDDQFGGGLRRKAVLGQLAEVAELIKDGPPSSTGRRLYKVMAHLAETAAIMSWDSGCQGIAQRHYALALRACRPAGDRAFAANVMAGMARQLLYLGHPHDALELIRLAQYTARDTSSAALRSMLLVREAWAYAQMGRLTAFRRATAMAEEELASREVDADPYWITYYDEAELHGTTGGRLLELARLDSKYASEAADRIEQAVRLRTPGRLRSDALDRLGLAEAWVIQGEYEQATLEAEMAVTVAERTGSDRVGALWAELQGTVAQRGDIPALGTLRDITQLSGSRAPAGGRG